MGSTRGTPIDNKIYCEKDGNVIFEDGNIKLCGRGNHERKLVDIQQLIDDHGPVPPLPIQLSLAFIRL